MKRLPPEQKRLVMLGGGGIVLLLLAQFVVVPLVRHERSLDGRIRGAARQLSQVQNLAVELEQARTVQQEAKKTLQQRGDDFSLFAYLNRLSDRLKMRGFVTAMRPSSGQTVEGIEEQVVEMRLENLPSDRLVRFLYELEVKNATVSVNSITLRKRKKTLDVDLIVSTLVLPK